MDPFCVPNSKRSKYAFVFIANFASVRKHKDKKKKIESLTARIS